jgi:hypothetical protein
MTREAIDGCHLEGVHMSARVEMRFNSVLDVFSAKLADVRVVRARPSRTDSRLIFKLDDRGKVVGIELLSPTDLPERSWRAHPDRDQLPTELLSEVDAWLEELWAHLAARAQ